MILVCDIGGTTLRVARSRSGRSLSDGDIRQTPDTYDALVKTIISAGLRWGITPGDACVIGVPGTRNEQGEVTSCPFIPFLIGKNLSRDVAIGLELPTNKVICVNDAYAVGLGEVLFGAGIVDKKNSLPDVASHAFITVSTGVGGALFPRRVIHPLINRTITVEDIKMQFEPGRMFVETDQNKHTLESLISGGAVARATGRKPRDITDPLFWTHAAKICAYGLWNVITVASPSIIIVGGPMILRSPGINIDEVRAFLDEINAPHRIVMPKIITATLGDYGGLYGCLAIAQALFVHSTHDTVEV